MAGRKLTQWHAELHRSKGRCVIYNEKEQIVEDIKAQKGANIIDAMRSSLVKHIRLQYGDSYGHELKSSSEIGEGIYDIPVDIVDMARPVVGGRPLSATEAKQEIDNILAKAPQVRFANRPPRRPGYYWYSADGDPVNLEVVKVAAHTTDDDGEVLICMEYGFQGQHLVEEVDTEETLWSVDPIAAPQIQTEEGKPVVDHEEW